MNDKMIDKDSFDGSFLCPGGGFEEKTGRKGYLGKSVENLEKKFFFDRARNRIRSEYTRSRPCPICGHGRKELVFEKDGFRHVRCGKCGFLHVDPILNDEAMTRHYEEEDAWTEVMLNEFEREVNKKMYVYTLNKIREFDGTLRKILDVGAGTGLFVEVANGEGFEAVGTELNRKLLGRARRRGIRMLDTTLEELVRSGEKFDLVTSWFVLEHVPDPGGFIGNMKALLAENGKLFVAVPNIDALSTRLLFRDSPTFAGYSHINFFNADYLNRLAAAAGLVPLHAETYVTGLNTVRAFFGRLGLSENSGIKRFLDGLSSAYIHGNLMGNFLCCLYGKSEDDHPKP